jgi:hypothetical protein
MLIVWECRYQRIEVLVIQLKLVCTDSEDGILSHLSSRSVLKSKLQNISFIMAVCPSICLQITVSKLSSQFYLNLV